MSQSINRAEFLKRLGGLSALAVLDRSALGAVPTDSLNHPEPRAGITSDKVLKADDLGEKPRKAVLAAYDAARQSPQIFDGLACACGCHGDATYQHRSLLVCYETRQPTGCQSCQMESAFVGKMVKAGKSLAEIRAAVDKKFGD
jgi:hypothetical protein